MTFAPNFRLIALPAIAAGWIASPAQAGCTVSIAETRCVTLHEPSPAGERAEATRVSIGARFVVAPQRHGHGRAGFVKAPVTPPRFHSGDILPEDIMVLINRKRHGLSAPRDGWTYFRDGDVIYRADLDSRRVLDRVEHHRR